MLESVDSDHAARDRPEAAPACLVSQIARIIHRARKDALPGKIDDAFPIWRPEVIGSTTHEALHLTGLRAVHGVQLCEFNDPGPSDLHRRILAAQVRNLVHKPRFGNAPNCGGFQSALAALKD